MYERVYAICLEVTVAMGDDMKGLSWFASNKIIDEIPLEE